MILNLIKIKLIIFTLLCYFSGIVTVNSQNSFVERRTGIAVVNPVFRSEHRETLNLNGTWDFSVDPENKGVDRQWFNPNTVWPDQTTLKVPGCWEAQGIGETGMSFAVTPEQSSRPIAGTYRGAGWYRKAVEIPAGWNGKKIWLKIGGVHAQGWFWVNGVYLGHDNSYCGSYKYDITDLVKPGTTAVIVAQVRNDVPSGKGLQGWIQRFGGLYRGVEIDATSPVFIDDLWVLGDLDQQSITLNTTIRSENTKKNNAGNYSIGVKIYDLQDGKTIAGKTFKLKLSEFQTLKEFPLIIPLAGLKAWSPDNPHLYRASVVLLSKGHAVDGWEERFGVKKWEVRNNQFYLNNKPFFVRGFGDDYIYPETLCSPASREAHRKNLEMAKKYGFVYVRHHTHCELPEFYDIADELGIMVQPELPYYGTNPSAADKSFFRPKEDLKELYEHYRRYVSLSTYCTGNEGYMGSPLDVELYELSKELDPTRLILHQDGGYNYPQSSDFFTGPLNYWKPVQFWKSGVRAGKPGITKSNTPFPYFNHEYLNLATEEDPRLEMKYCNAMGPPVPMKDFLSKLEKNGMDLETGIACLDAGNQLQKYYQKFGLEAARRDPNCGGYIYWTIVDVGSPSAQGLLNQFWESKASQPDYFRQFNQPTAILADFEKESPILEAGAKSEIHWLISHFDDSPIQNKSLVWELYRGKDIVQKGSIAIDEVKEGTVAFVGTSIISSPPTTKPEKYSLVAKLDGTKIVNSWDLWSFPPRDEKSISGKEIAVSETLLQQLLKFYPDAVSIRSDEGRKRKLFLTDDLFSGESSAALHAGKSILLLHLNGPSPGTTLGWWTMHNQRGTMVKHHPAFGDFPHEGFMGEQMFRLAGRTLPLYKVENQPVEPLMAGSGRQGYLAHVFQAKVGNGKVLASGLNLLQDIPEALHLLDNFIKYTLSDLFSPSLQWDISLAAEADQKTKEFQSTLNGWSHILTDIQKLENYSSFFGGGDLYVIHGYEKRKTLSWMSMPVPEKWDVNKPFVFRWAAASGFISQKDIPFLFSINDKEILTLHVSREKTTWTSECGRATLEYDVLNKNNEDTSGIMELKIPWEWVIPGKAVKFTISPVDHDSSRWFGIYDFPQKNIFKNENSK